MGVLWAVVYLKTKNIWLVVMLHALYNISGLFFQTVGTVSNQFDTITIVLTTFIGLIVAFVYWKIFLSIQTSDLWELYQPIEQTTQD